MTRPSAAFQATPAAGRTVPLPDDCRATPRSPDSVIAFTLLPHPPVRTPAPTPVEAPVALPADPATVAAIEAAAHELIACRNAGDLLQELALFSDDGLARSVRAFGPPPGSQFVTLDATPAPSPRPQEARIALVDVRDVGLLPDGRVVATVVLDSPLDPRPEEPLRVVFVEHHGRWLIDEIALALSR